jgi:hypothetical protein
MKQDCYARGRVAVVALALAAPSSVHASGWHGFGMLLIGLVLVPAAAIATALIAMSFARRMHGGIYMAATALFLPIAWYGHAFFFGEDPIFLAPTSMYSVAVTVIILCAIAYGTITVRYWHRFISIRSPAR